MKMRLFDLQLIKLRKRQPALPCDNEYPPVFTETVHFWAINKSPCFCNLQNSGGRKISGGVRYCFYQNHFIDN
jgi:hypothetical protein